MRYLRKMCVQWGGATSNYKTSKKKCSLVRREYLYILNEFYIPNKLFVRLNEMHIYET